MIQLLGREEYLHEVAIFNQTIGVEGYTALNLLQKQKIEEVPDFFI